MLLCFLYYFDLLFGERCSQLPSGDFFFFTGFDLCNRKSCGCGSLGRVGRLMIGRSRLSLVACRSVLEQDTEPQIAPDEQLAPCMAASVISVWMCVWMGECGMYCTALWAVVRLERSYKKCRPYIRIIWGNIAKCLKCFYMKNDYVVNNKCQSVDKVINKCIVPAIHVAIYCQVVCFKTKHHFISSHII